MSQRVLCSASLAALVCAACSGLAGAAVVLEDSFGYTDGALVSQGSWAQTGSSTTNPIQVSSGVVALATTGQDANKVFPSAVSPATGGSLYTGVDVNLASAQTGDYFLHLSDSATSSAFYQRLYVKSTAAGYVLGLLDTAGTGSATTWGTQVLDFNTSYRLVVAWNPVAGDKNDTFAMYVSPTDVTEAANTAYLSHTWSSTQFAEPTTLGTANLRQGSGTAAAALTLDNLTVATTFAEAAAIPEPASLGLLVAAGIVLAGRRRKA